MNTTEVAEVIKAMENMLDKYDADFVSLNISMKNDRMITISYQTTSVKGKE